MLEKTYEASTYEEVKQIMEEHPGFIKALWCGSEECELKMKEISTELDKLFEKDNLLQEELKNSLKDIYYE